MRISEINWGNDSAEQDPNLLEYFVDSDALRRLQSKTKNIVIGRKGSGKSALRKRLQQHFETEGSIVVNIAPKYSSIRNILNEPALVNEFGQEIFFQHTWLSQTYLDCLCAIGTKSSDQFTSGHWEYARNLARDRLRTPKDLVENIADVLNKVKVKAGKLGDFGLQLEKEIRDAANIDELEHHVVGLAREGVSFVVLFDDLDLGWDNSPLSNKLLLGLLSACNYLTALSGNIFPCVFMREDVYSILILQSAHADKFRNVERIRWEKPQLVDILVRRIQFSRRNHGFSEIDDTEPAFSTVFPESISTSNTDNWLIERTLSRPRELIQFARYYTEGVAGAEPDAEKLKAAELDYSSWKLDDLCSEYSNQYPGLSAVFTYWKTTFRRYKYHLERSEIQEMLLAIAAEVPVNQHWFNEIVDNTDIERFLRILYEIGFIGDFLLGGAGGSKTFYSFSDQHQPSFAEVQIHPCFRRAVNTVERIRNKERQGQPSGIEMVSRN